MREARRWIAAALVAAVAVPAAAQDFHRETLFRRGAWEVAYVWFNTGNYASCEAGTWAGATSFSIWGDDYPKVSLQLFNGNWHFPPRAVRELVIDVDYERFSATARADGSSLFVDLASDIGVDFVEHLITGTAVAVYNNRGARIATLSLSGSAAALSAWTECWTRAMQAADARRDPFDARSAPAASAGDPFL